ncbi:MAG: tetratricopeptide repeat protein [Elusimicrobiaceae bacterium]|nr:tetratricopeptide repeat protein [Elusimicrobiaceae bacterium]
MLLKRAIFLIFCTGLLLAGTVSARAGFPFSFRKQELKTDYSQTVWDQIMQDQSASDMRRGMGEMAQARYREASNSFAKAVIKNAKDPMAHLLFGAALYWEGKVDDAISEYNEALRLAPNSAMAYQLLGIAFGWKGDVAQAQEYFLTANKLDPNKADTNMNLGSTYAVQNNLEKALEHFRRATEFSPREPLYHYQLGTLYEALGRDEQAEASFKKALRLFSSYEDAQLSLGALYEKLGRQQDALKYFKKAVKTKPGDYVARLRYAFLLVRTGDEAKARETLEEAFSISRFKAEGLALNAVYRASGRTAQSFEKQIEKFKESLSKVAPSKAVNVEVGLEFEPTAKTPSSSSQNSFEQAYERLRPSGGLENSAQTSRSFKRMFTLPPADAKTRETQIDEFISGVRQAVAQGDGKYNVNLSLQGRTADFASPHALTAANTSAPKAVYDPRIVGNDMGLWVMGKTWLKLVDEASEDLQDFAPECPKGNICALLTGLAGLARGDSAAAQVSFSEASSVSSDPLAWLGLGTANVIAGDDDSAQRYYRRALEADPANKTAARNLKVLAQ